MKIGQGAHQRQIFVTLVRRPGNDIASVQRQPRQDSRSIGRSNGKQRQAHPDLLQSIAWLWKGAIAYAKTFVAFQRKTLAETLIRFCSAIPDIDEPLGIVGTNAIKNR